MSWTTYSISQIADLPHLDPPARVAVIGDPVAHSRSPQMHNPGLKARGIDAQYVRIHVRPQDFHDAVRACQSAGLAGLNCTIPHKFAAFEIADDVDPLARQLGAVNTLVFQKNRILGRNTDGPGLERAIEEAFQLPIANQRVLILGAGGGAGRAAAIQCALAGCADLTLVNRTHSKLFPLADEIRTLVPGIQVSLQPSPHLASSTLIINASSVGMNPGDPLLVEPAQFTPHHLVFDMIYSPPESPLLAAARQAGARTSNGLGMLLHQGAASFHHWFGDPVPLEAMRRGLLQSLQA